MQTKSESTLAEVTAEIRNYVERHPGDSVGEITLYCAQMYRWGWFGKVVTLDEVKAAVRAAKAAT